MNCARWNWKVYRSKQLFSIHFIRGKSYFETGDFNLSQFEFDECLTINNTSIISFYWRAKLKNKLEEFFEAVEDLEKSISLFNSSSNLKIMMKKSLK